MARRWVVRWVVSVAVSGALLGLSGSAGARETFPGILVDKYGSPKADLLCPPPCTICHTTPAGGFGTANMPFGLNVVTEAGMLPGGIATTENFPTILKNLEQGPCLNDQDPSCPGGMCTVPCDSDGDGTSDIAALKKGLNPNNGNKLFCVTYGCGGASLAPKPEGRNVDGTLALAMLGALVVLARRLRRA